MAYTGWFQPTHMPSPYPQQAPPTPFGDVGVNGLMGVGETWKEVEFSQEPGG